MEIANHGRGTPRFEENPAALVASSSYLFYGSVASCEVTTALLPRRGVQEKEESWGIVLPTEVGEEELRILASEDTAHQISTDPWYQVGFILTTGINSSYVLGYSRSIMVPLGWMFGTVGLLLAAAISLYANSLVARLHEVGGRRQIRYRDLAGHVYGRKMYGLTWALQYVNLFMINTGYIILAGKALKPGGILNALVMSSSQEHFKNCCSTTARWPPSNISHV